MKNLEQIAELATKLPKEVKDNAVALIKLMGSSIEGIGDEPVEWKPELAKILQATSDRSGYPKNTPIGSIIVGETIMEQPIKVIPFRMWDGRQYWSPDQTEAKMLCSSPDGKRGYIGYECKECPHAKWDTEANRSDCSKIKQVAVITSDLSKFFIMNFAKTNYSNGTEWASQMKKAGVQTFKRMYEIKTETHKQYKNVETVVVSTCQDRTPDAYFEFLQAIFDKFSADRTEFLEVFHTMALKRAAANNQLMYQAESSGALPATIASSETAATGEQATLASKYTMD